LTVPFDSPSTSSSKKTSPVCAGTPVTGIVIVPLPFWNLSNVQSAATSPSEAPVIRQLRATDSSPLAFA